MIRRGYIGARLDGSGRTIADAHRHDGIILRIRPPVLDPIASRCRRCRHLTAECQAMAMERFVTAGACRLPSAGPAHGRSISSTRKSQPVSRHLSIIKL